MATDLAEFLGAALGFHLLFGIPLFPAAILTGVARSRSSACSGSASGRWRLSITAFVGVIGVCYLIEIFLATRRLGDDRGARGRAAFAGTESVLLAVGILGATVMPHVIYLHSALTQNRIVAASDAEGARLLRYTRIDVLIAMAIAGLVNIAMLVMAAARLLRDGSRRSTRSRRARTLSRCSAAPPSAALRDLAARLRPRRPRPSARWPARSSCRASSAAGSRSGCAGW